MLRSPGVTLEIVYQFLSGSIHGMMMNGYRQMLIAVVIQFLSCSCAIAQNSDTSSTFEVFYLYGPQTAPKISQNHNIDSIRFQISDRQWFTNPEASIIEVSGEHRTFRNSIYGTGSQLFTFPWNGVDTVFYVSFLNNSGRNLGAYKVGLSDVKPDSISGIPLVRLPEVTIISALPDNHCYDCWPPGNFCCDQIRFYISAYSLALPSERVNQLQNLDKAKMPLHANPKIEFGTYDLPGVDLRLGMDPITGYRGQERVIPQTQVR